MYSLGSIRMNTDARVRSDFLQMLKKEYNVECELYSSALNNTLEKFCSINFDIERYFGSIGESGLYL